MFCFWFLRFMIKIISVAVWRALKQQEKNLHMFVHTCSRYQNALKGHEVWTNTHGHSFMDSSLNISQNWGTPLQPNLPNLSALSIPLVKWDLVVNDTLFLDQSLAICVFPTICQSPTHVFSGATRKALSDHAFISNSSQQPEVYHY